MKKVSDAAKKYFSKFLGGSSDVDKTKPLNFTLAQEHSLHVFLQRHKELLKNLESPTKMVNHEKFVNVVYKIYKQLRKRQTLVHGRKDDWIAYDIAKVRYITTVHYC